jgi:alkaline phosphatase D
VDLVVVADHGMVTLQGDPINLGAFAHLEAVHTDGSLLYAKTDADAARLYAEFKANPDAHFSVYRRAEMPAHLHYDSNPREGDPVVVPNGPYSLRSTPANNGTGAGVHGNHGFDPSTMPEMKAIFFADGPDIKAGVKLAPFENVNVYPFIAHVLGLTPPPADGKLKVLAPALRTK